MPEDVGGCLPLLSNPSTQLWFSNPLGFGCILGCVLHLEAALGAHAEHVLERSECLLLHPPTLLEPDGSENEHACCFPCLLHPSLCPIVRR